MKRYKFYIMIALLCICYIPVKCYALEEKIESYTIETKYFKTTTHLLKSYSTINNQSLSYTEEISEEEYNKVNTNNINSINGNVTIETTYKKMTTSIEKYNLYYRYKVILDWKKMPSTRSYDIIAIGFPQNVKTDFTPSFENRYCISSTNCYTSSGYEYSFTGKNGVGVVFKQPTGSLYSLTETLSLIMSKNTASTIFNQYAYGDYAHATETISLDNAKNFTVNTSGIVHNDNSSNSYDTINTARATWTGSW